MVVNLYVRLVAGTTWSWMSRWWSRRWPMPVGYWRGTAADWPVGRPMRLEELLTSLPPVLTSPLSVLTSPMSVPTSLPSMTSPARRWDSFIHSWQFHWYWWSDDVINIMTSSLELIELIIIELKLAVDVAGTVVGCSSGTLVDLPVLVDGSTVVDGSASFSADSGIAGYSSAWAIKSASGSRIVGADVVGISEIWLDTGWMVDTSGAADGVPVVNNKASGRSGDPASATRGSTPGIVLAIAVSGSISPGAPFVLLIACSLDSVSFLYNH